MDYTKGKFACLLNFKAPQSLPGHIFGASSNRECQGEGLSLIKLLARWQYVIVTAHRLLCPVSGIKGTSNV